MNLSRAVRILSIDRPEVLADLLADVAKMKAKQDTENKYLRNLYRRWELSAQRRVAKLADTIIWSKLVDPMTLRSYQSVAMSTVTKAGERSMKRYLREQAAKAAQG